MKTIPPSFRGYPRPIYDGERQLGFTIDILVRTESESNLRTHHFATHKRKRRQQRAVETALRMVRAADRDAATNASPVHVRLCRVAGAELDPGNLEGSFKHVQDAIARWLGVDDGDGERVRWTYAQSPDLKFYPIVNVEFLRDPPV